VNFGDIVGLVLIWSAVCSSFIVGLFWNSHAYQRGYRDGLRSAYQQWGPKHARFIYGDDTAQLVKGMIGE
jgi:hypothetical protein